MQVVDGTQHMRAVGALLASRLDEAVRLEVREQRVEQLRR
jgi:hypothetical protein